MVDSADPGFYGAAWRFSDFCQQLSAGSVYLQFVLKSCEFWRARPSRVLVLVSHQNELHLVTSPKKVCRNFRKRLFLKTARLGLISDIKHPTSNIMLCPA